MDHPTPVISARDVSLKTLSGPVYSDVSLDANPGEVLAVCGPNGSGKTALLLTLAGRMKPASGTLSVCGHDFPRHRSKAARCVGLSFFQGVNEVQDSLKARAVVRAELDLHGAPHGDAEVARFLEVWGLSDAADERISALTAERRVRLGVALACVGGPKAIVVDDIEDQLTLLQSERVMALLRSVARRLDIAVVVGVVERDLACLADSTFDIARKEAE